VVRQRSAIRIRPAIILTAMTYRERIFAKLEPQPRPATPPIKITPYAASLLRAHAPLPEVPKMVNQDLRDHQYPPRYIGRLWEPAGERSFERIEVAYNGVTKRQEAGNLTHELTSLIKTR